MPPIDQFLTNKVGQFLILQSFRSPFLKEVNVFVFLILQLNQKWSY